MDKPVRSRHRWDGGGWGKGRCVFCGHTLDEVIRWLPREKTVSDIRKGAISKTILAFDRCYDINNFHT